MWLEIIHPTPEDSSSSELRGLSLLNLDSVRRITFRQCYYQCSSKPWIVEAEYQNGDRETIAVRESEDGARRVVRYISLPLRQNKNKAPFAIDFGVWPKVEQLKVAVTHAPDDLDDNDPFSDL